MKAEFVNSTPTTEERSELQKQLRLCMNAGRMGTWECRLELSALAEVPTVRKTAGRTANMVFLATELQSMLGLAKPGFDGRLETLLERIVPADRPVLLKAFKKAMRYGTEAELDVRFSRPGRSPGWLLVRGRLLTDGEGRPERLLGVAVDITARKTAELHAMQVEAELQHKLAARSNQLQAINQELEAFCYSVSHDLRAPLRSVRGFNEVLLERYAAQLDDRGREFLRRACESSQYMDRLIDDLLKLSRLGRVEMARRPVDLGRLAVAIAESLKASAPDRCVIFQIAPDLQASGDERLLRIVLENLLGNAWKFTSKRSEARIEFGYAPAPVSAFFVRDNGAGFDPSYAGRLFGLFQRLHAESEFAGTGVGLAITQRIINRHGGRVWAEGAIDAGATFYFTLSNDELL